MKNMNSFINPFGYIKKSTKTIILSIWLLMLIGGWTLISLTDGTHLFPTIDSVYNGIFKLYNDGLVYHIFQSISLCLKSILYSVIISLIVVYISPFPILSPLSKFISTLRYLPLTGISFYISILFTNARDIQVWVLVLFMTTYMVTSLLAVIADISEDELNHAKTLGCSKFEILWEVIIKGRFDYVIDAIRSNMAIVWVMLITAESILIASGGIGVLIKNHDRLGNFGNVIALQIIIIFIGLLFDWILVKIRKISFPYSTF